MRSNVTAQFLIGATLAALALVSMSSCGGADGSEGTGGAGGGSAGVGGGTAGTGGGGIQGDRGDRFADTICTRLHDCCKTEEIARGSNEVLNPVLVDYAACRLLYRGYWQEGMEYVIEAGSAAGRLAFDENMFDQCLAAYASQPCGPDGAVAFDSSCLGIVPKVEEGGGCQVDEECKTGECLVETRGDSEGTCVQPAAKVALGGACQDGAQCDAGLVCLQSTCSEPLPDGTPCQADDDCVSGACMKNTSGLCATVCVGGGPGPGASNMELEALLGRYADAYCEWAFACCDPSERFLLTLMGNGLDSAFSCHQTAGLLWSLLLARLHVSSASGRLAFDANALASCVDSLDNGTCGEFGPPSVLEPCADAVQGLVANGQDCDWDAECVSRNCVVPEGAVAGTCTELPGEGEACTEDCKAGYYCEASVCVPTKPLDAPCTKDEQCAQGPCVQGGDAGAKSCALTCDGK